MPDGSTPTQDFVEIKQEQIEPYIKSIGRPKLLFER